MAGLADEPDFHFFGTEIEDERETRLGQHHKKVTDPSATRALPLHKQEVTDEQGRRRFHGAFTGGFSAGYFNTVGSKEGWQPGEFRSSRDSRAAVQQSVEQYLDEDELEELRRTNLQTTAEYDTFGSTAAELARRTAADAAAERPSAIPGLLPDELVVPVADSVGIRLLQKMGWRQGKGIGVGGDAPTPADEEAEEGGAAAGGEEGAQGRKQRRWGQHVSVAAENTQLYLLAPKTDVHGLGFDPFKGAEDFRRLKEQRQAAARPGQGAGDARKRRRGIAFGSGVLDEEDGYGHGASLDDYVTHDDVGEYDDEVEAGGMPRSRVPKLRKGGLGDRLANRGYSFEITEEEEEPAALEWHPHARQHQYALPGREAPLLLQSREQAQGKSGLVPGFVRATVAVVFAYFPPPRVPPGYVPLHRPSRDTEAALPAVVDKAAPPPQAEPPADPQLRQAIDSLAFFVARNGIIFESMVRQRQQKEGQHAFLSGGEGAAYYRWKVHSLRSIIQPHQQQQRRVQQQPAIGQRSAPLSADERGALLGEQPLAAAAAAAAAAGGSQHQGWATGAVGGQQAAAAAIAAGEAQQALRRQLLQVAEGDRRRLQQLLSCNFVAAESQDMLHPDAATAAVVGLRPGAPAPPPRPPAGATPATDAAKVVTQGDLSRQAPAAGGGLALRSGPAAAPAAAQGPAARRLPVRRSEEWRPLPLLCKRLNVPDPYHGRPAELQMSRFRTDHLVLPDTAAAVASSLAAVPAGAEDFLLPPSVAAAIKEAEAKQQLQLLQAPGGGAAAAAAAAAAAGPGAPQPPAVPQQPDAAGAADAFLSSLSGMLGGGGEAAPEAAPPLPPGPQPPLDAQEQQEEEAAEAAAAAAERPVDLFKAIFEDSEEEEEEEEEAADITAHQQQPEQQLEQQPGAAAAAAAAAGGHAQRQQGGLALVDDHSRPAQQAQQQQQQQQWPLQDASFGFAKLRQQPAAGPPPPPLPGPAARAQALPPASVAAAAAAAGALDDATKQRVQEALRALRKDKKERRGSKKNKKKKEKEKERKEKKSKSKGKERARSSKQRKGRGSKHRHGSGSSGGSSGSSGSGSDSE